MESQRHPTRVKPINPNSVLPMTNLPAELITEIFLRFPVKSLLKFRSVSKSWLTLISSPDFVKKHLLLSANNKDYTHHGVIFKFASTYEHGVKDCSLRDVLYHPQIGALFDLDYPCKNRYDHPFVVGSVNGLICLAFGPFKGILYDLFIWNPSVRKHMKLPNYELNLTGGRYFWESEAPGDFKFGFGYDELQDDYKIVGVFPIYRYRQRLYRVEVKIYSLRSNSWRCIDDFQGRDFLDVWGKFVNGKLHWLEEGWKISSIDLGNEKWAEVEKPCNFNEYRHLVLGVLGSNLSVLCNNTRSDADVWVMKEYGLKDSWTKMFTIKSPDDIRLHIRDPPILISNEGDILLQFGSRLGKYNPKDDSIRYLDVTYFAPYIEAELYVKSLVCPFYQRDHACNNNGGSNNSVEENRVTNNLGSTTSSGAQVQPLSL